MATRSTVHGAAGVPLHVRSDGEGEPVLLVHGTIGSSGDWSLLTPQLSADHRVIRYDRRGRGRSGDGERYELHDEVVDLVRVLDWIGEPAHVVAHSFGARLALLAAGQTSGIRSLVLYEPPLEPEGLGDSLRLLIDRAEESGDYDPVARAFLQQIEVSAEQEALMRSLPSVWSALLDGARTVRREVEQLTATGFDPGALQVPVPSCVLIGGDTTATVFLSRLGELCSLLGTEPRRIPGQRHLANVFGPELLAHEIRRCLTT
jgi:pimeloyl-ACP methyl ester carboxylesterase